MAGDDAHRGNDGRRDHLEDFPAPLPWRDAGHDIVYVFMLGLEK